MQAGVLDVVGGDLLLPLDLHADLEADGAGDRTLVASLLQVVPDVHLARQGPDLECSAKMKNRKKILLHYCRTVIAGHGPLEF